MKAKVLLLALVPFLFLCCTDGNKENAPVKNLEVTGTAFQDGATIPRKHTQDGEDISPPVAWSGTPDGVKEYALIMDDPYAPMDKPFVHWVVYKIPPDKTSLEEGDAGPAVEGRNTYGRKGYAGPKPPEGDGPHHYHIMVYALDEPVELYDNASKNGLMVSMEADDRIIGKGELTGIYER